ncbi:MAG TPA: hypothetical protein VK506_14260 [Conexibacter sp.]|nr:hypothetical protein [Conexibacter sp.]
MDQVSRPMQIALVATALFAMVWFVALRPKPSDGGGAPAPTPAAQSQDAPAAPGTDGLTGAVDQAERAVATANGDAAPAPAPARAPQTAARAAGAGRAPRPASRAIEGGGLVGAALRQRKAVAIAFVDPRTADARAVREEMEAVSRFGGRAVALAVPISQLSRYEFITREVEVTVAPTVVIVSPKRTATTIVGFADRGEIEQGLADALSARGGRR